MSNLRMKELPDSEMPRERLLAKGPGALSEAELLAILLRTGTQGANAVDVARSLLAKHQSLTNLLRLSPKAIAETHGIGMVKAIEICAALHLGERIAQERFTKQKVDTPREAYALLGPQMQALAKESLRVLLLDTRFHLMRIEEVSRGTLNETIAHPRDIFAPAIIHSAYAILVAHNHPSGDPTPSEADLRLTRLLAEAAKLLKITLIDHLIIGTPRSGPAGETPGYYSFKEAGLL